MRLWDEKETAEDSESDSNQYEERRMARAENVDYYILALNDSWSLQEAWKKKTLNNISPAALNRSDDKELFAFTECRCTHGI